MDEQHPISIGNSDDKNVEKREFLNSALSVMTKLAEEAGDWRGHLPYEALVYYRTDSNTRAYYYEHLESCTYCQKALHTLNPDTKRR